MIFTKRVRDGVRRGEITCSVRVWTRPHVTLGKRYRMEEGEIEVDSILPINLTDVTPELARASGFKGLVDLLKVAKHGRGENVYLVRFHFIPPGAAPRKRKARRSSPGTGRASKDTKPQSMPRLRISSPSGGSRRPRPPVRS